MKIGKILFVVGIVIMLILTKNVFDTVECNINAGNKILVYYDSIGCMSCKLKFREWNTLIDEIKSYMNDLTLVLIVNPKIRSDIYTIRAKMRDENFDYPICIDLNDEINKLNHFPDDDRFRCFLLDENNRVVLIGSIRVFKWDKKQQLPIEKIFGINPMTAIHDEPKYNYWHIGRFAIDSFSGISTLMLFKQLVFLSIKPIIEDTDSYMIAEMDSKLLRTLNALGIETIQLGESVQYLHSETIPVCAKREGLLYFYNKYKDILKNK
jgi:hypothetical protein